MCLLFYKAKGVSPSPLQTFWARGSVDMWAVGDVARAVVVVVVVVAAQEGALGGADKTLSALKARQVVH